MEKNITLQKNNINYNISIKLVSELIVFHIETSDFPKKIYENSFSDSDMKSKHKSFFLCEDIKIKFELLKESIKEPSKITLDKKDNYIQLQIPSSLKNLPVIKDLPPMNFEIYEKKRDINDKISELYSLYKDLKNEKDININDLYQKNEEFEAKFEEIIIDINDLYKKNKEYEANFEGMNNDINYLYKKNKEYETNFEKMNYKINDLYQKNETKFVKMNNMINDLYQKNKEYEANFKEMNKEINDSYRKNKESETKFEKMNYKINDLYQKNEAKFVKMNNIINDLHQKNKNYETKIEKMNNEVNDLYQKNKNYEKKIEDVNIDINILYQKNKNYAAKFEKMNKEINDLKEEIKNLKEQFKNNLEDDYNKKINNFKNLSKIQHENIEDKIEKSEKKITDKLNELDLNFSSLQNQIFILTFNNLGNFKIPFEEYYNRLKQNSDSNLFTEYYKCSFDIIVQSIFEIIKRNKDKDNNKIIEYSGGIEYKSYTNQNWNWFLINNVIYQMIFCDIKLNEDGVDETLDNIYELNQDFKKYKSELEKSKSDIKTYVKEYRLGNILEGIKRFTNINMNILPDK